MNIFHHVVGFYQSLTFKPSKAEQTLKRLNKLIEEEKKEIYN